MRSPTIRVGRLLGFVGALPFFFWPPTVQGQTLPPPRITIVMPPGGQAGSTFEVIVTGTDLSKTQTLHFDFPGAKVEVLSKDPVAVKPDPKQKQPAMKTGPLTQQKFKVTLPANAPLGIHDLRIVTQAGVSNPRAFIVGDLKDVVEQEPNDDVPKIQAIQLNTTVSGTIANPTDVDYFQFTGQKGQRVVASCLTTSMDSKLPALVQIFSQSSGAELASNRSYQANDALTDIVLPADGNYYIRVSSFSYTQGGPDYFYRLSVSTAPWIDAVFPNTVAPGQETKVTVIGRNLPGGAVDPALIVDGRPLEKAIVTVKAPGQERAGQRLDYPGWISPAASALDGFHLRLKNASGSSNPFMLLLARGPIVKDEADNDLPDKCQAIDLPCEIAGRFEKKNDRDWFQFSAKKGQVLSIEAFADRLGSGMDLYVLLQMAKGQTIVEQDDNPEILAPQLFSRTDDPPRYRFSAPADGDYRLLVASRDAFTQFGPRFAYTARLLPEQPDFRLIAMPINPQAPEALILGQGSHQAFNVFVWRLGGFTGAITVSGENLPPGLSVRPQTIAGNQKQGVLVVGASKDAEPFIGGITILGAAVINGEKVVREARSATITWPVPAPNLPAVSRLDRQLVVAVRDKAPYTLNVEKDQITVVQGEKITIPVTLTPQAEGFKANVQVAALSLPPNMTSQPLTLTAGKGKGNLIIDYKGQATPGNFTLVLRGQTQPINPKQPAPPKAGGPPNLIQHAPPIQLSVIPKTLAKLALPTAPIKVPVGKQADLVVKIGRLFDYAGSFKVEAILPPEAKGLTILPSTIKAGEDEVKLTIRADADSKIGANASITIRAIAMFNQTPVTHEGKVTVSVGK